MDIIYEDELPEDLTDAEYDLWFKESYISDGVRVGPKIDGLIHYERSKGMKNETAINEREQKLMNDNWTQLSIFVDKHQGELVLNYFEVVRLDDLVDIPDDYYFRVSGQEGNTLLSCVGRVFLLKNNLDKESYDEIERVFNLNIDQWIAGQESRGE